MYTVDAFLGGAVSLESISVDACRICNFGIWFFAVCTSNKYTNLPHTMLSRRAARHAILLVVLLAVATRTTCAEDATTFAFSRLRQAQDLSLTLDLSDGTMSRSIYAGVCSNTSAPEVRQRTR